MTEKVAEDSSRNGPMLSVVLCTHDPRQDHLQRTLDGLNGQTMPLDRWELIIVDNASQERLVDRVDLNWHPNGRHVREERLGLTPARLRGIEESTAGMLLFVDDDNVLPPTYLADLVTIAERHPTIGVIGAGRIEPEFEVAPDPALGPYLRMLALRVVSTDQWSNDSRDHEVPWGAGMAVRRTVALKYREVILADPLKQRLDRAGNTLNSCGDDEFSWVACEMGYGKGLFTKLSVTHLIGRARLQREYLLRLAEGHAFSRAFLMHLHGMKVHPALQAPSFKGFLGKLLRLHFSEAMFEGQRWAADRSRSALDRSFDEAKRRGVERFFTTIHG